MSIPQITVREIREHRQFLVNTTDFDQPGAEHVRERIARYDRAIAGEQDAWWLVRLEFDARRRAERSADARKRDAY